MFEGREERVGGLWKGITENLLCDNCRKELPRDATPGRGKHALLNPRTGKLVQYCTSCYYYYIHRNDRDIKEKEKLR